MRDDQIVHLTKKNDEKIAALYRQIQFMRTRIEAYERCLSSRWDVLKCIWSPRYMKTTVDSIQSALIQKHDQDVREASEKAREEARKPKLTVVNSI